MPKSNYRPIAESVGGHHCIISTLEETPNAWIGRYNFVALDIRGEIKGLDNPASAAAAARSEASRHLADNGQSQPS